MPVGYRVINPSFHNPRSAGISKGVLACSLAVIAVLGYSMSSGIIRSMAGTGGVVTAAA
jgi:hypothetical protein